MPAKLENIRSHIGYTLPYVFVESIALAKGNMRAEDFTPTPTELNYIKNKYGTNKSVISLAMQEKRFFSDTDTYSARLKLSVRDFLYQSFWFERSKKPQIKIVQSTHPYITDLFMRGNVDISSVDPKYRMFVQQKIVPIPSGKRLSSYRYKEIDGIDDVLCKIDMETTFQVNSAHLTYFLFAVRGKTETGVRTIEKVLHEGRKKTSATSFYLPNGEVWSGPVHYHDGTGWMGGRRHTSKKHPRLKKVEHFNSKIKDLRVFDRLLEQQSKISLNAGRRENESLFSSLYMSMDRNRAVRGLFAFSPERFLKFHSRYNMLLKNADLKQLMSFCTIDELRVVRTKMEKKGKLDYDNLDQSADYDLVATASDTRRNGLRKNFYYIDDNNDGKLDTFVGGVKEVYLENVGTNRVFSFYDSYIKDFESGRYGYKVEIRLTDPTVVYLNALLSNLEKSYRLLKDYHGLANRSAFYDGKSKRFTSSFLDLARLRYGLPSSLGEKSKKALHSPWRVAARDYLKVLESFVGPISTVDKTDLISAMCPSSGDLSGVEMFFKLAENMLNSLGGAKYMQARTNSGSKKGRGDLPSVLSVEHSFDAEFDASTIKNYGLSYFGKMAKYNSSGPVVLSRSQVQERFRREASRFGYTLPESGTKSALEKYYSTVAPLEIDYSAGTIDLLDIAARKTPSFHYAHSMLLGLKSNPAARSISVPAARPLGEVDEAEVTRGYMGALLGAGAGVTIEEDGREPIELETRAATGYLSEEDNFSEREDSKESSPSHVASQQIVDTAILSRMLVGAPKQEPAGVAAVQLEGTTEMQNIAERDLLQGTITKVHYIVGFDKDLQPVREKVPVSSRNAYLMVITGGRRGSLVQDSDIYDSVSLVYPAVPSEEGIISGAPQEAEVDNSGLETEPPAPEIPPAEPQSYEPEPSADSSEDIRYSIGAEEGVSVAATATSPAPAPPTIVISRAVPEGAAPIGGGTGGY